MVFNGTNLLEIYFGFCFTLQILYLDSVNAVKGPLKSAGPPRAAVEGDLSCSLLGQDKRS